MKLSRGWLKRRKEKRITVTALHEEIELTWHLPFDPDLRLSADYTYTELRAEAHYTIIQLSGERNNLG
jgi:hypothetical protein